MWRIAVKREKNTHNNNILLILYIGRSTYRAKIRRTTRQILFKRLRMDEWANNLHQKALEENNIPTTVWSTWKVTILNIYCGNVFRVRDLLPFDLYYKFTSILFSGKKFWHIQFLNFTSFLWIFIEGGMVKLENWWQNFPFFIPYIKMDMNSLLESHIKKFLSYLSKSQYWFKIVTFCPI